MENIQLNLYGTISLIGAIQGIILALIFIFNKKYAVPSSKYVVMLLLACLNINIIGIADELGLIQENDFLYLPISLYPLITPAVYFSIHFIINPDRKIKLWEYSLYIPFIIGTVHNTYTAIQYFTESVTVNHLSHTGIHYYIVLGLEILNGVLFLTVFISMIFCLKKHEKALYDQFSELSSRSVQWLINSLIAALVLTILWLVTVYLDFNSAPLYDHDERVLWVGVSVLVYWVGYGLVIRPELFLYTSVTVQLDNTITPITLKTEPIVKLSDNTEKHHQKLIELMSDKALFRDPDLNMDQLAQEMNLSKGYLSQIINNKEQKNFFDFVNYYRIEEIKRKLKDKAFTHFSIMGIATDSGFKSKSTFNAVFKKMTGMTPSQFRKQRTPPSLNR